MPSPQDGHVSPEVRQIIIQYLREKADALQISTFDAIHAVRTSMPDCDLTNRELADLIGKSAVDAGFVVSFDGKGAE